MSPKQKGGPDITSFTATPSTIGMGSTAILSWTTTNVTQVTISGMNGTLPANGTVNVSPSATTTYTLLATGPGGQATATVTVTVTGSTAPTVQLSAQPESINAGQISTLTWTTSNATAITFTPAVSEGEPGELPLQGHATVSPAQTTTYVATVTGQNGATATASVTVTVTQVPPTVSFAAKPTSILAGQSSTLSWTTTNATAFQIDQGIGSQPVNGSVTVQPTATTTYTATASGPGGTQTAQTTVTVAPPGTVGVSITANPTQVASGQAVTLAWQSQNAVSVDIEPGVGKQGTSGTATVNPTATTTYTATATDVNGKTASANVTVTVVGAGDLTKIKHIIFFLQENRSFDMYFGKLGAYKSSKGFADDVDGFDPNVSLIGFDGRAVSPFHERTQRTEDLTPFWNESHFDIHPSNGGFLMDRFLQTTHSVEHLFDDNGDRAIGFYDQTDLPVYYELAAQFATSDRWFSPVLTQTIPNRMYMFASTSFGHIRNGDSVPSNGWPLPTIFDRLDDANIPWKYYYLDPHSVFLAQWNTWFKNNGQDQGRVRSTDEWFRILNDPNADTLLAPVVFIERGSTNGLDEHPDNNVTIGAGAAVPVIEALMHSAAWQSSVLIFAYDEGGGLYDHVPPFNEPSPDGIKPMLEPGDFSGDFTQSGFRVPLIVISPWVKPHFVSHVPRDNTAILKFIETRFNLKPLNTRDGAQDNMLEFFNFSSPALINPPPMPSQPVCPLGSSPCDDRRLEAHP